MTGSALVATPRPPAVPEHGVRRRRRAPFRPNWPGTAILVGLVLLWQGLVSAGVLQNDYVPGPAQILGGLADISRQGELGADLLHTVSVLLGALGIAAAAGVVAGLIVGRSTFAWNWLGGTIDVLRSLPVIVFVPVALVVFGLSGVSELVVAAFAAVWPILINTAGGVQQVHPRLYDVGRTLALGRRATFVKIAVPAAAPAITVGLRIGATVSLIVTILAEMVGNPAGIGHALVQAQSAIQPAQMYAYVLVVLVIGLLLNAAVVGISRLAVGDR